MFDKLSSFLKVILNTDIVKVFSLTALSTFVKMLTGLITVKVIAVIIGPSGIALLGQLNNFYTIILNLASGGINSGVTKYIAEEKQSEEKLKNYISTAFKITLFCSIISGLLMIILNNFLSKIIMHSEDFGYVFIYFGFTIVLYALNNLILNILNGFKEFKKFVKVNIANSIIGLVFTLCFVYLWGLKGALISAVTYQSVTVLATLWMVRKLYWMKPEYFKMKFAPLISKQYLHYSLMALVSIATLPISHLIIRGYVISNISSTEAGWWEAMNRISAMYLMVITSSFVVYYLPRLSEIKERSELRKEIFTAYKVIIPTLCVGFFIIYILRSYLVNFLFTPDFYPMENLFIWQLLGDLFKIASWLLAFLMVAKSMTITFISTEVLFSALFTLLSFVFIKLNGIVGITQAYFINYVLHMITMAIIFRKIIR